MYPNKARAGSVLEPDKAQSVVLTLGLWTSQSVCENSEVFGQLEEHSDKAEFSDSNGRNWTSVVGFGQNG
ncbi:hypothetical protein Bca101_009860 [Brassica carinata]